MKYFICLGEEIDQVQLAKKWANHKHHKKSNNKNEPNFDNEEPYDYNSLDCGVQKIPIWDIISNLILKYDVYQDKRPQNIADRWTQAALEYTKITGTVHEILR